MRLHRVLRAIGLLWMRWRDGLSLCGCCEIWHGNHDCRPYLAPGWEARVAARRQEQA